MKDRSTIFQLKPDLITQIVIVQMPTNCEMNGREFGDVSGTHWVQLQPFAHQVGGHVSMLRFDDCTICKPLIARENNFYTSMPRSLTEFTPEYRGVITVAWQDNGLGGLSPVVCRSTGLDEGMPSGLADITSSSQFSNDGLVLSDSDDECQNKSSHVVSSCSSRHGLRERASPVGEASSSHQAELSMLLNAKFTSQESRRQSTDIPPACQFILLENLAYNFRLPCVLDLKMGTRQHGDDASESKRLGQMKKCADTTSSTLGLRVCGMQVYQSSTDEYICHSKYHGRRLDCDGVRRTLRCFLHDGRRLLTELVCSILDRLRRLEKVIKRLDSYRFYSSSLLIMYDGADIDCGDIKRETAPRQLAVCMIDFAHATHSGFLGDPVVHIGPDRGYLFGLQNLIRLFEEILADTDDCSVE